MINFNNIEETKIENFRGGEGVFKANMFTDSDSKIMRVTLEKGSSIGVHKHESNCEIMYVISGEGSFYLDGEVEVLKSEECHYCPKGHTHWVKNTNEDPLVMFCVVAEVG